MKYKIGDQFRITKNNVDETGNYSLFTITKLDMSTSQAFMSYRYKSENESRETINSFKTLRDGYYFEYVNKIKTILPLP